MVDKVIVSNHLRTVQHMLNLSKIEFMYHKIHPFKVYNSVVFNYIHKVVQPSPLLIPEYFQCPKK